MSVVIRYSPGNLTKEKYDEVNSRLDDESWPPDGLDMHVCFGRDGDLRVSEIWDSEEQWRAFAEKLMPVLSEAGIEMSADPDVFEVHELQKR
jgi:hypothetical protein